MRSVTPLAFLFAMTMAPSAAMGCERTPDLASLPNEAEDEFEKRLSRIENQQDVVRKYQHEEGVVERSPVIYVARVVETSRSDKPMDEKAMPWAVVKPIKSIKGKLPTDARRLTIKAYSSCTSYGDGYAAGSKLGSIVFVFEGLPKSEVMPNGIDSLPAGEVLTHELIEGLDSFDSFDRYKP